MDLRKKKRSRLIQRLFNTKYPNIECQADVKKKKKKPRGWGKKEQ